MALGPLPLQSSPFAPIVGAMLARLSGKLCIPQNFIVPVANDEWSIQIEEPFFIMLRIFGPAPSNGRGEVEKNRGAGRLARNALRRFRAYVYTRNQQDPTTSDQTAILGDNPAQTYVNATLPGQTIAEDLVINALDDWTPIDPTGTFSLTINPVRWIDSADGPPERPPETDAGLIRSHLDFDVEYVQAQNPAEPPP